MKYGRLELAKYFGLAGFEELVQVLRIPFSATTQFFA